MASSSGPVCGRLMMRGGRDWRWAPPSAPVRVRSPTLIR